MERRNIFLQKTQIYPLGGRGRLKEVPLQYPVMKEKDILELVHLHLLQKKLRIPEFDDMKMLYELFAKPPDQHADDTCYSTDCTDNTYSSKEDNMYSLFDEKIFIMKEQYNYIDFLKTLEEKDCFVVIEHVPSEEVTNIEALIYSFGEIVLFRDCPSRNENEKILLVKLSTVSECNWVVSCLDGHSWGEKVLKATNVNNIFDDQLFKTESPSKVEDCVVMKDKYKEQFEDDDSIGSDRFDKELKTKLAETELDNSVSQYLNLPSTCSLSHETIHISDTEYDYVTFLQTLREHELYSVVEHIPLDGGGSLENLILTFGKIELFHVEKGRNGMEKIGLVKMEKASNCESLVSCLNNSQWGESTLTARKVHDILLSL